MYLLQNYFYYFLTKKTYRLNKKMNIFQSNCCSSRRQNEKTMNKDINKKNQRNRPKSVIYLLRFANSMKNYL